MDQNLCSKPKSHGHFFHPEGQGALSFTGHCQLRVETEREELMAPSSPCKVQQFNWIICLKDISPTGYGDTFDSTTIFYSDFPTTNPQFRYLFFGWTNDLGAICTVHISQWKTGTHWYCWNRWTSEQLEPTTGSRINTQRLRLNVADPSNVEPWEILRAWDFRMSFSLGGKVDQKLGFISLNLLDKSNILIPYPSKSPKHWEKTPSLVGFEFLFQASLFKLLKCTLLHVSPDFVQRFAKVQHFA